MNLIYEQASWLVGAAFLLIPLTDGQANVPLTSADPWKDALEAATGGSVAPPFWWILRFTARRQRDDGSRFSHGGLTDSSGQSG
jgi:hypothetical protein